TTAPPFWFSANALTHWLLPTGTTPKKPPDILVYRATTGEIRKYWQFRYQQQRSLPTPRPPRSPAPALHMRPNQWKRFWKLKIPHGARNFWWRLLLCKLPTRLNLRHINDEPPLCQLCRNDIEDDYHMVFDCPRKKSFWLVARNIAHIKVPMEDIWDILNFRTTTDDTTMLRIGEILMVIWQLHWHCCIDNVQWNTTHALRRLRRVHWLADLDVVSWEK
ncbi:hypothetical protein, partial, partial [Absidia glauca]